MKKSNLIVGLLSVLVVFAVAPAFKAAQTVLIPLMIAWLLSSICGPVVTFLVHKKIPLGLAVFAVLILVLGVCYLGGIFLIGRVQSFAAEYPKYANQLQTIYTDLMLNLSERMNECAKRSLCRHQLGTGDWKTPGCCFRIRGQFCRQSHHGINLSGVHAAG